MAIYTTQSLEFANGKAEFDVSNALEENGATTLHFCFAQLSNTNASTFVAVQKVGVYNSDKKITVIMGNAATGAWYTGTASVGLLIICR